MSHRRELSETHFARSSEPVESFSHTHRLWLGSRAAAPPPPSPTGTAVQAAFAWTASHDPGGATHVPAERHVSAGAAELDAGCCQQHTCITAAVDEDDDDEDPLEPPLLNDVTTLVHRASERRLHGYVE